MNLLALALLATLPHPTELPSLPCPYENSTSSCAVVGCKGLHTNPPTKRIMSTIKGNIDVKKIDKEKLYKGKKGTYLDVVLIPTPNSEYGDDFMIVQSVSKEDRDNGIKGAILGNAKFAKGKDAPDTANTSAPAKDDDEEVPF